VLGCSELLYFKWDGDNILHENNYLYEFYSCILHAHGSHIDSFELVHPKWDVIILLQFHSELNVLWDTVKVLKEFVQLLFYARPYHISIIYMPFTSLGIHGVWVQCSSFKIFHKNVGHHRGPIAIPRKYVEEILQLDLIYTNINWSRLILM